MLDIIFFEEYARKFNLRKYNNCFSFWDNILAYFRLFTLYLIYLRCCSVVTNFVYAPKHLFMVRAHIEKKRLIVVNISIS